MRTGDIRSSLEARTVTCRYTRLPQIFSIRTRTQPYTQLRSFIPSTRWPAQSKGCRCQVHTVQTERTSSTATAPTVYKVPTYVQATGRIVASKICWPDYLAQLRLKWSALSAMPVLTLAACCIAVGDIHGDLRKAISSLEVAQVLQEVNGQVRWAGGDTVVVQLGDVLDRGDSEIGASDSSLSFASHTGMPSIAAVA